MGTILQIIVYCFLFWLPVRCALKDSGQNCLYFYPKEFLEEAQRRGRDDFDVTIQECLWHRACQENGCGELCRLFCDVDDVIYGGLRKMGFSRTKTLGYGGDCCDFHFFRK